MAVHDLLGGVADRLLGEAVGHGLGAPGAPLVDNNVLATVYSQDRAEPCSCNSRSRSASCLPAPPSGKPLRSASALLTGRLRCHLRHHSCPITRTAAAIGSPASAPSRIT